MSTATPTQAHRPYRQARHPSRRDRWSAPAILDALRAWAHEMGGPPRRQDWTGEQPQAAGAAQRRWMREHPCWPSSSCVAGHFGSWGAALEAAGLPVRRLHFIDTPAERVAAARRLAASGVSLAEIAACLGVSRSSVHNYLNAQACPRCAGPVTNPHAALCLQCTRHQPSVARTWTRADVRRSVLEWTEEHAQPPTYRDWTPACTDRAEWDVTTQCWPTAAVVCRLYDDCTDPWNGALRDAGARARHRHWSDAAIRLALANVWTQLGRPPSPADLHGPVWDGPSSETLRRRCGSLARAWNYLGPAPDDGGPRPRPAASAQLLRRQTASTSSNAIS
jgi:hypothetical protein